ncbi:hypothetical protein HYT25_01080 [Candidatus Pacearchaeota archaeon]|nr:hypothetical protein [Candidatus Pacearchaeota archaeon]
MNETLEAILQLETVIGFIATGFAIEFYRHFSKNDSNEYDGKNSRKDIRYKN